MSFENKGTITFDIIISLDPDRSGNLICDGVNDHVEIQQAIDRLNGEGGGTIFIKYCGSNYQVNDFIEMKSNVAIYLDNNVTIQQNRPGVGGDWNHNGTFNFQGSLGSEVENAHVICLERARVYGVAEPYESGVMFEYANFCSVVGLEILNVGQYGMRIIHTEDSYFERIYIHQWGLSDGSDVGLALWGGTHRNDFVNLHVDGEDHADAGTCCSITTWGEPFDHTEHNVFLGGVFERSGWSHGIYIHDNFANDVHVRYNTFNGIICRGNTGPASNSSGFKFNPGSHNIIEGAVLEGNNIGLEVNAQVIGGITRLNKISATINDNDVYGIIMGAQDEDTITELNDITATIEGPGNTSRGLIFYPQGTNSVIRKNRFNIEIRDCNYGIVFGASVAADKLPINNEIYCIIKDSITNGVFFNDGALSVNNRFFGYVESVTTVAGIPVGTRFDCPDFITHNWGTQSITGAVNTVVTAHGLAGTVNYVFVTPLQQGCGDVSVSNKGAANFNIDFANQPGGATWYFDWYAVYEP